MIDLHCHFLPGIDDGARDMEEALQLLTMAQLNGISKIVLTPHINPGYFDNTLANIQQGLQALQVSAQQHGLKLQLAAAAEVRLCAELPMWAERGALPFLGEYQGFKVLLLEFPHSHIPAGADKLVKWLQAKQILPMIAHPERNRDVQQDLSKLMPFRRAGCLFQLTASSVLGDMGDASSRVAHQLLQEKAFDIVATDSHNLLRRPPKLAEARDLIAQQYGADYAELLTHTMPAEISQSHFLSAALP